MLIKEVGDGTFGSVWRAINKQTGEVVSICWYLFVYLEKNCLKNDYFQFYNLLLINRLQLKKWRKSITHGRNVSIWEKWRWCILNFLFSFRLPSFFSYSEVNFLYLLSKYNSHCGRWITRILWSSRKLSGRTIFCTLYLNTWLVSHFEIFSIFRLKLFSTWPDKNFMFRNVIFINSWRIKKNSSQKLKYEIGVFKSFKVLPTCISEDIFTVTLNQVSQLFSCLVECTDFCGFTYAICY